MSGFKKKKWFFEILPDFSRFFFLRIGLNWRALVESCIPNIEKRRGLYIFGLYLLVPGSLLTFLYLQKKTQITANVFMWHQMASSELSFCSNQDPSPQARCPEQSIHREDFCLLLRGLGGSPAGSLYHGLLHPPVCPAQRGRGADLRQVYHHIMRLTALEAEKYCFKRLLEGETATVCLCWIYISEKWVLGRCSLKQG